MTGTSTRVFVWVPRVLGIGIAVFFSLFALDAVNGREPLLEVTMHLLPVAAILLAVAAAWRRPLVGAVVFTAMGVAYALTAQRLDWVAVISTPLLVVGAMFLASAFFRPTMPGNGNG